MMNNNIFNLDFDKVLWSEGKYEFYTIERSFKDMGTILYELRNPQGILSGGRVPQKELSDFILK